MSYRYNTSRRKGQMSSLYPHALVPLDCTHEEELRASFPKPPSNRQIPKIIHQTYKPSNENELPKGMRAAMASFKNLNCNYSYRYYGDEEALQMLMEHFGKDSDEVYAFQHLIPGAYKIDFWRYAVLWIHGGYYADADMVLRESLDSWISPNATFVLPVELGLPFFGFNIAFMGSVPRHPLLRIAMDMVIYNVKNKYLPQVPGEEGDEEPSFRATLAVTGPILMGKAFNRYLNEPDEAPHNIAKAECLQIQILGFCKLPYGPPSSSEFLTTIPNVENFDICEGRSVIRFKYPGYDSEQKYSGEPHYVVQYHRKQIFL
ncbi:hypothetical protein C9374_011864 [Naegleria lovaniensis]|uniref:Uncharacterized protein n=1 Tax=Naegleria lovaniensis TaxID=51637 RepID=A0AA88KCD8_NAELO|nr:uncharacterized protein C9374_011864 [Naegleria lovaniensis]KAG2373775.1 hypothetical protein C9374_011864 [Naegleria lovaniensis]